MLWFIKYYILVCVSLKIIENLKNSYPTLQCPAVQEFFNFIKKKDEKHFNVIVYCIILLHICTRTFSSQHKQTFLSNFFSSQLTALITHTYEHNYIQQPNSTICENTTYMLIPYSKKILNLSFVCRKLFSRTV